MTDGANEIRTALDTVVGHLQTGGAVADALDRIERLEVELASVRSLIEELTPYQFMIADEVTSGIEWYVSRARDYLLREIDK